MSGKRGRPPKKKRSGPPTGTASQDSEALDKDFFEELTGIDTSRRDPDDGLEEEVLEEESKGVTGMDGQSQWGLALHDYPSHSFLDESSGYYSNALTQRSMYGLESSGTVAPMAIHGGEEAASASSKRRRDSGEPKSRSSSEPEDMKVKIKVANKKDRAQSTEGTSPLASRRSSKEKHSPSVPSNSLSASSGAVGGDPGSLKIKIKLGQTPSVTSTSPTKDNSVSLNSSASGIPVAGYQSQAFQAALSNPSGPLVLLNYPKFDLPLHFPQQLLARANPPASGSSSPTPPLAMGPRELTCLREELEALRESMKEFRSTMQSELKKADNLKLDTGGTAPMIIEEAPTPRKRGPKPNINKLTASTGSLNTSTSALPFPSQSSTSTVSSSASSNLKSSTTKLNTSSSSVPVGSFSSSSTATTSSKDLRKDKPGTPVLPTVKVSAPDSLAGLSAADLTALEGKRKGRRKGLEEDSKGRRKDKKTVVKLKRGDTGSEDDEINVDVVDDDELGDSGRMSLDTEDDEDDDFERSKRASSNRKRNPTLPTQVTAPSPPKKKGALPPTSSSGRPLRARVDKKRKRTEEYTEEEAPKLPLAPNTFWATLEPYITPIAQEHLALLAQVRDDPRDEDYSIPPLGPHYIEAWAAETTKESSKTRHSSRLGREAHHHRLVVDEDDEVFVEEDSHSKSKSDKNPACGDLTQRLLAAFIESKVINIDPKKTPPLSGNEQDLSLSVPPVHDYHESTMLHLEERIRIELKNIGLLDDEDFELTNREDDEICAELRSLQAKLREQRTINNQKRQQLYTLAVAKMKEQEQLRRKREEWQELEQAYYRMVKAKKRPHKKRRPDA